MAASRRKSKWDVTDENASSGNLSATDAARERAAKLNAMLAAQGKLAKGAPPHPMVRPSLPVTPVPQNASNNGANKMNALSQDLFTAEVDINDSPARVILCRSITQDEINRYSGAAVSTKGKFMSEMEKIETEQTGGRPLYLSVQGLAQQKVDLAVKRIREIMNGADIYGNPPAQQMPLQPQRMPVPPHMATPSFNQPPPVFDRQPLPAGMHYVQDKVFVGLDNSLPDFSVKEKLLGPGGSYFQHIATQTGAKVQLRGKGSGFIEPTSGKEAFEALYIYISHSKIDGLSAAKKLVENLIETVHTEYKAFEQTRRPHYGYSPYMNVGNPVNMAHPPSGYQPPPYGYPHLHPPGGSYPQPPPGPGFHHNHPHAMPAQPPPHQPHPPHPGVPRGPPLQYGPPPPVAGYPNHPHPLAPPASGPAPYHSHPPNPQYPGMPPHGPPPPGPQMGQHPPHAPPQPPPLPNGPPAHMAMTSSPAGSQVTRFSEPAPQSQEPPRRKFTEKIPVKTSAQEPANGIKHQESPILNPTLGEAPVTVRESEKRPLEDMPPPPALPIARARPKEREFVAPPPRPDVMPPPVHFVAPSHGRTAGKRDASTLSQPAAAVKKQKAEASPPGKSSSSAIASLAAYGGEDSSDEEGSQSPDDKPEVPQKPDSKPSRQDNKQGRQGVKLPFWAVRH